MNRVLAFGLAWLLACAALVASAAEPVVPHNQDAAPGPALTPAEAIARMQVPPGFSMELVAAEPDIVNPVAMCFDDRGRIWITESLEYPRLEPGEGRDRIKVLEDSDGDGAVDRVTVFAEGLNIPSGIAVGHGGVWVANAPDILFLQDTDGDGRADRREVVVTGFGRDDTHELPNSLTWGPDGYLYGFNGVFNRSKVNGREFTCALFRIHPRTRAFEIFCEGTSNPWGIGFDGEGSAFVSACVIDHLWHLVETGYYQRQAGEYPPFAWRLGSIVDHTHQKAAYCGLHYYDSDAYPPEYRGRLYMGNIHGGCVNADQLEGQGSTYFAKPAPDFLTANDAWFMPVSQKTGPDGCLYVLDWYDRYHCYQDARRDPEGLDRLKGRLYRVRYESAPRAGKFDLARESDEELIARLNSGNGFFRAHAQRLLAERSGEESLAKLADVVFDDTVPRRTRMHALWAAVGRIEPAPEFQERLLGHSDAGFRAWGVRWIRNTRLTEPALLARVAELADDPSPDVRLQVAIAARKFAERDSLDVLAEVLAKSANDPVIPAIVWQNLHPLLVDHDAAALAALDSHALPSGPGKTEFLRRVLDRLLAEKKHESAGKLLAKLLADQSDHASARAALLLVVEQGQRANAPALKPLIDSVAELLHEAARDHASPLHAPAAGLLALHGHDRHHSSLAGLIERAEAAAEDRLLAVDVLLASRADSIWNSLGRVLRSDVESIALRRALLERLSRQSDETAAETAIGSYPHLAPELQPVAIELLTEQKAGAIRLMAAVESGAIPASAVNANQLRKLARIDDAEIRERVRKLWGEVRLERSRDREQVIARMRALLGSRPGDSLQGRAVFNKVCAQCHKLHGQGQEVGPEITLNGRNSWEQLLSNVFDPSLVIGPGYQARIVATTDGRVLTGLVIEDSAERVALKIQGGKIETLARDEIDEMETSPLSLMPEDLEKQLTEAELVDLFAYLALDLPPETPDAKLLPGAPATLLGNARAEQ